MNIDEFLSRVQQRQLPANPMARVELLARELAEGAIENLWSITVTSRQNMTLTAILDHNKTMLEDYITTHHYKYWLKESHEDLRLRIADILRHESVTLFPDDAPLVRYFLIRWGFAYPALELLEVNGFAASDENKFSLKKPAFDLLSHADPASIFISYKRTESSAFALLVARTLKAAGLEPFVDMQLRPGVRWGQVIQEQIELADYFVLLIGQRTLESEATLHEIEIAIAAQVEVIPVWHNGFTFRQEDWQLLPENIFELLQNTQTIRVTEENPLAYDTALREVLNRFGISG